MANNDIEVAVIGGGAAGVAAARRLHDAGVRCLLVEARARLGGRASSVTQAPGIALDVGCGWLHSAERNPWAPIAEAQGLTVDRSLPPWQRPSIETGFPRAEQIAFSQARNAYQERIDAAGARGEDVAASQFLEPGCRWNGLIGAVSTYVTGAEPDRVSALDLFAYEDTEINWRVAQGYGTTVAAHAAGVPTALECVVRRIDHSGKRVKLETDKGNIVADRVIITLSSSILAKEKVTFAPALPQKTEAAAGVPLGLADKLFLSLDHAEEFDTDSRLFGRIDRAGTGNYHFRPFGRPMIEVYLAGSSAWALEAEGEEAFFDFTVSELTGLFGSAFAKRIRPIALHRWGGDPFALGSYSCALPGKAHCRQALAAPVDDRLFFAGEAVSAHDFSTAHGAYHTGVAAAEAVLAARKRRG